MKINNDITLFNPENKANSDAVGWPAVTTAVVGITTGVLAAVIGSWLPVIVFLVLAVFVPFVVVGLINGNVSKRLGSRAREHYGTISMEKSKAESAYRAYNALPKALRKQLGVNLDVEDFVNISNDDAIMLQTKSRSLLHTYQNQQAILARTDVSSVLKSMSDTEQALMASTDAVKNLGTSA